jgi:hypothetical protein
MTYERRWARRRLIDLAEIRAIVTTTPEGSWLWLAAVAEFEKIEREIDGAG